METKHCGSCSMPMTKVEDFGGGDTTNQYCVHCCDENGKLKSYDEIYNGMVEFALKNMGISPEKAKEAVTQNMANMPAWKDHTN